MALTPLTLYPCNQPDGTLSGAYQLVTAMGAAATGRNTKLGSALGWSNSYPNGTANAWRALGGLPAPNGVGFIYNSTALEGMTIPAGTWTGSCRVSLYTGTGAVTSDIIFAVYKWHPTNGYTYIGSITDVATAITLTATTFTWSGALPDVSFATGEKLYFEHWYDINSTTATSVTNMRTNLSSSTTLGSAAQYALVTPGFDVSPSGGSSVRNTMGRVSFGSYVVPTTDIHKVQGNTVNPTATSTTQIITLPSGLTLGNLVVVSLSDGGNNNTFSGPSGWTQAVANIPLGSATISTSIWYLVVDAAHVGQTSFTFGISVSHTMYTMIEEWYSSTGWPSNPVDVTAQGDTSGAPTTGTSIQSGTTGATSQAIELVIASLAYKNNAQTESAITSGWARDYESTYAANNTVTMLSRVTTATGTQYVQYTIGTAQYWAGAIAAFTPNVPIITTVQKGVGRARVVDWSAFQSLMGRARFVLKTTRPTLGRVKITNIVTSVRIGVGRARISIKNTRSTMGRTRYTSRHLYNDLGRVRLAIKPTLEVIGRVKFLGRRTGSTTGRVRLSQLITRSLLGRAKVLGRTTTSLFGRARLGIMTGKSVRGYLELAVQQTRSSIGRIHLALTQTRSTIGRIRYFPLTIKNFYGRVKFLGASTKNLLGRVRVATTHLRADLGRVRLSLTALSHAMGRARVTSPQTRSNVGRSRIALQAAYRTLGRARVVLTHTYATIGRVRFYPRRIVSFMGRVPIIGRVTRSLTGRVNVILLGSRLWASIGRTKITAFVSKSTTGRVRFFPRHVLSSIGRAGIRGGTTRKLLGRATVLGRSFKSSMGRVSFKGLHVWSAIGRMKSVASQARMVLGRTRLVRGITRSQLGRVVLSNRHIQAVRGRATVLARTIRLATGRIKFQGSVSLIAMGRVRLVSKQTLALLGRVRLANAIKRAITGRARVASRTVSETMGRLRFVTRLTRSLTGRVRMALRVSRNALGLSRIAAPITRGITARTRVVSLSKRSGHGRFSLALIHLLHATGLARVVSRQQRMVQGIIGIRDGGSKRVMGRVIFGKPSIGYEPITWQSVGVTYTWDVDGTIRWETDASTTRWTTETVGVTWGTDSPAPWRKD